MSHGSTRRLFTRRLLFMLPLALVALLASPWRAAALPASADAGNYTNPLKLRILTGPLAGTMAQSCADPTVIRGQQPGDRFWYLYCTKDPLNDQDKDANGNFNFHNIPMFRSLDLANWTYVGDAFSTAPAPATPTSGIWAPEVVYMSGLYYLYYTITDVNDAVSPVPGCGGDSAIGVATSPNPTGPWTPAPNLVVPPRQNSSGCDFFWTFDPDVITDTTGQNWIYYGSYYGGIQVRQLSADGYTTDPATMTQITIPNRYEATEVEYRNGYYYLFASAANCCNGELTGYSVFAGRSTSPTGPFTDRENVSLLQGRVGGTPVLSMNGNRWVGPGHNTVFKDLNGRYWTIYHAVNRADPYFAGTTDFTKRPALMDRLEWGDGFPTVRGNLWASDTPQPAPAAQPGDRTEYPVEFAPPIYNGANLDTYSDEFNRPTLSSQWQWVRPPAPSTYFLTGTSFSWTVQAADLYQTNNSASVLTEAAPPGEYIVETKVRLNLPPEGCCQNYTQAGLVIYGNDDNYIKLVSNSIWETRQTEFAKEYVSPTRGPFYGNTVVGPPGDWTWLRIVKQISGAQEKYTAFTSFNGRDWVRGGVWTHSLGAGAKIGLVSLGSPPDQTWIANFDYVRVYRIR